MNPEKLMKFLKFFEMAKKQTQIPQDPNLEKVVLTVRKSSLKENHPDLLTHWSNNPELSSF